MLLTVVFLPIQWGCSLYFFFLLCFYFIFRWPFSTRLRDKLSAFCLYLAVIGIGFRYIASRATRVCVCVCIIAAAQCTVSVDLCQQFSTLENHSFLVVVGRIKL